MNNFKDSAYPPNYSATHPPPTAYNQVPQSNQQPPLYNPPNSYSNMSYSSAPSAPLQGYSDAHSQYYNPAPPPPQSQQQTTVVVSSTAPRGPVPGVGLLPDVPMSTQCPHCCACIVTRTEYRVGTMVWLVAGILCMIGLIFGCCLIPFCLNSLKDVDHFCTNCNSLVGRKVRLT